MRKLLLPLLAILLLTTCKKKDASTSTPSSNYGSVVFWTNNSAKLAACSNSMSIRVTSNATYAPFLNQTVTITMLSASAPMSCMSGASVSNLYPSSGPVTLYGYQVNACASGGTISPFINFNVSDGECLKIEIP